MKKGFVRMIGISLNEFKNVGFGEITFMNYSNAYKHLPLETVDIVGLYGQNGSGKTALIEAIDILSYVLKGETIPFSIFSGLISDSGNTSIIVEYLIKLNGIDYKATYTFYLRCKKEKEKIELYREKLSLWDRGATWKNERWIDFENPYYDSASILESRNPLIDTNKKKFTLNTVYYSNLRELAIYCSQNYCSVFFNELALNFKKNSDSELSNIIQDISKTLHDYGNIDLQVVRVNQLAEVYNISPFLPLNVRCKTPSSVIMGCMPLFIQGRFEIPEQMYSLLKNAVSTINIAMGSIVPSLQIQLEEAEKYIKDNQQFIKGEVYSIRNNKKFSIQFESEGIKRIISLVASLVSVYNDENMCLVVDELDSGIFEYLLGDLLGIFSEEMKGQLIFTSHNLRVLEKLGSKNIVCSTTNPYNRYVRMKGIEKNHNRRDFYIRALTVGGQQEELYDKDDLEEMGYAFRKAGKVFEKMT